jgi:hypothetical protein
MTVHAIDPINDARWHEFLCHHPAASIFHTPKWLEALRLTYGYKLIVFTTSHAGQALTNGIVFCEISNWLGTRRLVSLPFSDHCVPLVKDSNHLGELLAFLQESVDRKKWTRLEIRAVDEVRSGRGEFQRSTPFVLHKLDLSPGIEDIFRGFHRDCVQRKISRAGRENLVQEAGTSETLLSAFYGLLLKTRRRHGVPPQPISWFRNLIGCLGDKVTIRAAFKDAHPVAAILTLQHKQSLVYKYGCSDESLNHLGGMQMLFWNAIQDAKSSGLSEFDMGRSECDNLGLVTFKSRWGAAQTQLSYLQYPAKKFHSVRDAAPSQISKRVLAHMPDGILSAAGRALYKYMG